MARDTAWMSDEIAFSSLAAHASSAKAKTQQRPDKPIQTRRISFLLIIRPSFCSCRPDRQRWLLDVAVWSLFSSYDRFGLALNQGTRRLPVRRAFINPGFPKSFFGKRLCGDRLFNEFRHTRDMLRIQFIESLGRLEITGSPVRAVLRWIDNQEPV